MFSQLEKFRIAYPVPLIRRQTAPTPRLIGIRKHHQFRRITHWEIPQQDGIHQGEDHGVGAKTQRQRKDDYRTEPRAADKLPQCITKVSDKSLSPADDIHLSSPLPVPFRIPFSK